MKAYRPPRSSVSVHIDSLSDNVESYIGFNVSVRLQDARMTARYVLLTHYGQGSLNTMRDYMLTLSVRYHTLMGVDAADG